MQLAELASCQQRVKHYLVVSATHQYAVHAKALADYHSLSVSGCVLTKLDESARLGDSLSAIIQANLPVAYVTTGIRIPDDVRRADALPLIKQALLSVRDTALDPDSLTACFDEALLGVRGQRVVEAPLLCSS